MNIRTGQLLTTLCFACAAIAAPASSEQPSDSLPALHALSAPVDNDRDRRRRLSYNGQGIQFGDFTLVPKGLSGSTASSSTVSGISPAEILFSMPDSSEEPSSVLTPGLLLKSDWRRHAIALYADMDLVRHGSNVDEEVFDLRTGIDGKLEVSPGFSLEGGARFAKLHDGESALFSDGTGATALYNQFGFHVGVAKGLHRRTVRAHIDMTFSDFDDAPDRYGGLLHIDESNRREIEGTGRIGYDILPNYETFVRGTVKRRAYVKAADDSGVDRDSAGWESVAGLAFKLGGATSGKVYGGYYRQDFEDYALEAVGGASFGGDIAWTAAESTAVKLASVRTAEHTDVAGASGIHATTTRVSIHHDLLRELRLSLGASYVERDFECAGWQDETVGAGLGATYQFAPAWKFDLRYRHDRTYSDGPESDHRASSVFLRLSIGS